MVEMLPNASIVGPTDPRIALIRPMRGDVVAEVNALEAEPLKKARALEWQRIERVNFRPLKSNLQLLYGPFNCTVRTIVLVV